LLLATRELTHAGEAMHDAAAGALIGVAIALKPYGAAFVPYLVLKRNWIGVAAAAGALVIALAAPAAFYGVDGNRRVLREWATTLSQSTPALLTNNDNVSVVAFFAKWLGPSTRALIAAAAVIAVLGLVTWVVVRRGYGKRNPTPLECALLLTLIPLVSPLGWDYTFLTSLLAVALVVNSFDRFPRAARPIVAANFAVIALAVFDVMGRRAYAAYMQWSVTTINFFVVVAALTYLRFRTEL